MTFVCTPVVRRAGILGLALALLSLVGCGSFEGSRATPGDQAGAPKNVLRVDDEIVVNFGGIPNPPERFSGRVNENGKIVLPLVGEIQAAGKSMAELERDIKGAYVPRYYVNILHITVHSENRVFYVDGYVRNPSRLVYTGEMTVTKAIAAAGGFNEFANRRNVRLTRSSGRSFVINCDKALRRSELDLPVYPGDHIYVKRKIL